MRLMGGPELAGVGFAFGMERLLMVMESLGKLPEVDHTADVYVAAFPDDEARRAAFALTLAMRSAGLRAEMDHAGRGMKAQIKYAGKTGAKTMSAIGGDEVASGVVRVRDMQSGEETETKMDEAAKCVLAVIKGE